MNAETDPKGDDAAFDHTLHLIEAGFRLARPDALQVAEHIRDQYRSVAADMSKRLAITTTTGRGHLKEVGHRHAGRAARVEKLIKCYGTRRLYAYEPGGAIAAQVTRPARRDPVTVLSAKGHLEHQHEIAARDIARCYEAACREGMARVRDLRMFVPPPKRCGRSTIDRMSDKLARLHASVYLPWTRAMNRDTEQNLTFVMDIVVDGRSLKVAATDHRMGWEKGLRKLRRGLGLWLEIAGREREGRE